MACSCPSVLVGGGGVGGFGILGSGSPQVSMGIASHVSMVGSGTSIPCGLLIVPMACSTSFRWVITFSIPLC